MNRSGMKRRRTLRPVLWVARILGLLLAALVAVFAIAYSVNGEAPGSAGGMSLAAILYPFGIALSFLVGWRWPLVGGLLGLGCLIGFHALRGFGATAYWRTEVTFLVPAVLYVIYGLFSRPVAEAAETGV